MKKVILFILFLLGITIITSEDVNALSTTISNPNVVYSRWYTTQSTSPAISSTIGEVKQIPFRIITGGDTFLVGSDNWFSVDSSFLELTTYQGEFGYWYSSISGGDVSNCQVSIRSTTGNLYTPNCTVILNEVTANGGPVRYKFSGSMPTNEGIQRVDFRVGYVDCTNVNQCIPLSAGPVSITDFAMTITSTASSSTTQIVTEINTVNTNLTVISDKLDEIIDILNNMNSMSGADVEQAIENARESEKEEYEEQQENVEGGAEDAGDEAEAATSTLIETGRNIIETIRDTPATNCVIRINTRNFDTGNINLCNVPQEMRTMISTIITIPVTLAALHIAYTVVMLYLNTVRKEQE